MGPSPFALMLRRHWHEDDESAPGSPGPPPSSGLLAGAGALGAGELVAGFAGSWESPVVAVAEAFIDRVPRPLKDFAVEQFGTNDKVALVVGIIVVAVMCAAVLGMLGRTRPAVARLGLAAFGALGMWASQQATNAPTLGIVPSVAAAIVGIAVYGWLRRRAPLAEKMTADAGGPGDADRTPQARSREQPAPVPVDLRFGRSGCGVDGERRSFALRPVQRARHLGRVSRCHVLAGPSPRRRARCRRTSPG